MTAVAPPVFDRLAERIKAQAQGRQIVYIPNPGNMGDGLIRHATKMFFFDHRIRHIELNVGFSLGRAVILPFLLKPGFFFVYGGGGAWHCGCDFGYRICRFISALRGSLLVLPSTFALTPRGVNATLYRRDEGISAANAPTSTFCHDMALYLFAREHSLVEEKKGRGRLMAFRTDNESRRELGDLPPGNLDVSRLGDHMTDAECMFETIRPYESVTTDRLHVAIAALLLGKSVSLHPGSYSKIADIYEASLSKIAGARLTFDEAEHREPLPLSA